MLKKFVVVVICLGLIVFSGAFVMAEQIDAVELQSDATRMSYIYSASSALSISSNGNADIDVRVRGYSDITTQIKITARLQQKYLGRWVTIETFSDTTYGYIANLDETTNVSDSASYRVKATVTAYSGSSSETQTVYSSVVWH